MSEKRKYAASEAAAVREIANVFREQALREDRTGGPNPSAVFIDEAARRAVQTLRWIGWRPPTAADPPIKVEGTETP